MARWPAGPPVTWAGAAPLVVPMTADELVGVVAAVPGARTVPVQPPLSQAAIVAGVKVVSTGAVDEHDLRRLWRERRGSGATPVLLLADDAARAGSVLALGPADAAGSLRSVQAGGAGRGAPPGGGPAPARDGGTPVVA